MSVLLKYLIVLGVSMVPLIELRGAVPIGTGMGLDWLTTLIISIVGNCLPVPIILIFVKAVLKCFRASKISFLYRVSNWLYDKAEKNRGKIEKYAVFGLYVFVAIPLPGTGAWTGALVAALFDMPKKSSCISIFAGVATAGLIMTVGSQAVKAVISLL